MTFSNSSTELKRPSALTGAVICWPAIDGAEPTDPVANCTFCARTACRTSPALNPRLRSLSGLSQIRIEYEEPNWLAELTPGIRCTGSRTCDETMVFSLSEGQPPVRA